ncbi:Kelch repeat-containing protein [Sorangium sp. So ce1182]|uniref:Kelch repeat-containing protein n=1 Tax=Sorangium sp. So ce1182 TaxID=3133334 RepID=UPI003F5E4182
MNTRHIWMLGITLASAHLVLTAGEARAAVPSWEELPPMSVPRSHHTATLLQDGRVLVMGGATAVVEIYDPATRTWAFASTPPRASTDGPAVLLPNGHVFVVGSSASAIYDPVLDSWTAGATALAQLPSAVLLADGRVLVVGQDDLADVTLITGDIYDPESNRWRWMRPLPAAFQELGATLLDDGRVLVVSGTTDIYDPETDSWEPAADPLVIHHSPRITPLPGGDILVAGGIWASSPANPFSVEVYSVNNDVWVGVRDTGTTTPCRLGGARLLGEGGMASSLLPSGRVLLTGGTSSFSCRPEGGGYAFRADEFYSITELYDPELLTTSSIDAAPPVTMARAYHTSTRLNDGSVLITGGAVGFDRGYTRTTTAMLFHERSPLGAACEAGSDCASGLCVDAVCSSGGGAATGGDGEGGSGGGVTGEGGSGGAATGAGGTGGAATGAGGSGGGVTGAGGTGGAATGAGGSGGAATGAGGSGGAATGAGGSSGATTGEGGSGGAATGAGGTGGATTGEGGSGGTATGEGGSGGTATGEGGTGGAATGEGGTAMGEGGSGGITPGTGGAVVSGSGTGGLDTSSSAAAAGDDLPPGGGGCSAAPASQGAPAWLFVLGGLATTQIRRRNGQLRRLRRIATAGKR